MTPAPRRTVRYQGRGSTGNEAGFTLLEVIVALILTSLVVMLAYGAARVSFEAKGRLDGERRALQSQRAARQMLADALRNLQPPQRRTDPPFELHADRLSFVAAGGAPPLDPDYDWLISVGPAGNRVALVAKPLGHAPVQEVSFSLPQVTRWDVRVLVPGNTLGWLREWPAGRVMPRAVEMRFWNDSLPVGDPLLVTLVP
ncbi:MAG TPA: prepilin-type N-terminal cleavage/methylation domain-containing protein [Gemmatimonadales bacterium]|nr:prepilin-type N-terminal cleavage/methylation domain-containing protein [Gemmatimonadales bacterium]